MSFWSHIANAFRGDRLIAKIDRELDAHIEEMPPTRANGKICYLQIPANDIDAIVSLLRASVRVADQNAH